MVQHEEEDHKALIFGQKHGMLADMVGCPGGLGLGPLPGGWRGWGLGRVCDGMVLLLRHLLRPGSGLAVAGLPSAPRASLALPCHCANLGC